MKDEMDILREVGSIAAAHGSTALSEILSTKITLNLPSVDIIPAEMIIDKFIADKIIISIYSQILSGIKGNVLFLLDEASTFKLVNICYDAKHLERERSID